MLHSLLPIPDCHVPGHASIAAAANIEPDPYSNDTSPLPPSLVADYDKYDLTDLASIDDRSVLVGLLVARKISQVDYEKVITVVEREEQLDMALNLQNFRIIYIEATPVITPETVLRLLKRPLQQAAQNTPSLRIESISESIIVKYGRVDPTEATTMLFVREHTRIPVPTVRLVFVAGKYTYIVMQYIPGADLQHLWPTLKETERESVLLQVQQYIQDLRTITPPSLTPGPIGGGVCRGRWFSDFSAGPFPTHQDLVDWWNFMLPTTTNTGEGAVSGPLDSNDRFQADHSLVFTHCDFAPRNLILHEGTLWVVDWEQAGWYPAYLEYAFIMADSGDQEYPTPEDWKDAVRSFIPNYEREYRMLRSIYGKIQQSYRFPFKRRA